MASPGHRANVLDPAFTHGGVGAAAADNKMFQGYVQNTRMYTELFLQALRRRLRLRRPRPAAAVAAAAAVAVRRRRWPAAHPVRPQRPRPKPKPKPSQGDERSRQRPISTAGIDGVTAIVAAGPTATSRLSFAPTTRSARAARSSCGRRRATASRGRRLRRA